MASEPFRFLHASDLRLDEPPAGTGPLDNDTRVVAEDATLTALANIVDACLAEGVEFLLLTGRTFGSDALTLRARLALLSAFEHLREFEIQVFWEANHEQQPNLEIPDNVIRIHRSDTEPVAVVRQGRVIASVGSIGCFELSPRGGEGLDREERSAFRIAIGDDVERTEQPVSSDAQFDSPPQSETAAHDYLALSVAGRQTTRHSAGGLAHNPGPPQGTGPDDTGVHGATLVRVHGEQDVELTFVPAAPLRWERILVGVERNQTSAELAERMQSAVLELEPSSLERIWIVTWQMIGSGELFSALESGAAVRELTQAMNRRLVAGDRIRRVDRFQFRRRHAQHADELCAQIAAWIGGSDSEDITEILQELHRIQGASWLDVLREPLSFIDEASTRDRAIRLSQELLLQRADPRIQQELSNQ